MGVEGQKLSAAKSALKYVTDGMALGLGSGSTSAAFIGELGKKAKGEKLSLSCICTSAASEALAKKAGLKTIPFGDAIKIHLAVDGADQIDSKKNLIKGHGGALAREKAVAYAAEKFVVIADGRKLSQFLDKPVPVEALPFCAGRIEKQLVQIGAKAARLRLNPDGKPYATDNGLWIWDADFGKIAKPAELEAKLGQIPGVLENGLFTKNVWKVIIAGGRGIKEF